jgi:hypothetical protein
MSVGLSAYSIAVLSIQRYRVTVYPLQVRVFSQPTWRATGATICGVWFVAAIFALPTSLSKYMCFLVLFPIKYTQFIVNFKLVLSCVLPLCVIAISHIMTARHLVKRSYPLFKKTQNPQLNTSKNSAKVLFELSGVFLISYLPYHISETYFFSTINSDSTLRQFFNDYVRIQNLILISPILQNLLSINSCLSQSCSSVLYQPCFQKATETLFKLLLHITVPFYRFRTYMKKLIFCKFTLFSSDTSRQHI